MTRGAQKQAAKNSKQSKICPVCLLSFDNRKKWQQRGIWDEIVYCSARCRSNTNRASADRSKSSSSN